MNAQCFWLSSQSGQTQITVGQNHWCCAGGRRWCCAGSPSALMVLLCVWCVVGIGARAHHERDREVHTAAPKVRPHARACAHTRSRHRRGVGERPHVRWSVERTASLAVTKPRCSGGQTKVQRWPNKVHLRAEWPLQGVPSEKVASGRCSPTSTDHVALFGLSCTRLGLVFYPSPCFGHIPARCTLFWPPPLFF